MILDRTTFQNLVNYTIDSTTYPDSYLTPAIAAVQADVERYLHWNPVLQYHVGETGVAQMVQGGSFAGRYMVELKHQPLTSATDATQIFQLFQLLYPVSIPTTTNVDLTYVKIFQNTGQVFCLAPGAVEALVGTFFGFAPLMQRVTAVGYEASYAAGYATGINDPTPSGGGSGFTATATVVSGSVTAITVTAGGSNFTNPPWLTITGGGGSNATATATMGLGSVTVGAGGTGYTSAPTVSFSGGGGSGATATATVSGGAVTAITVTGAGSYTSQPTVSFSGGGGSGATATAYLTVSSVSVINGGTGYTSAPAVGTQSGTFGAASIPAQIQEAAALLLRERLTYDNIMNKNWDNPNAGLVYRRRVGERDEAYRNFARPNVQSSLGFGSPLSETAEMLLKPYQKIKTPYFI